MKRKKILTKIMTIAITGALIIGTLPIVEAKAAVNNKIEADTFINRNEYDSIAELPYNVIDGDEVIYFRTLDDYNSYLDIMKKVLIMEFLHATENVRK